MSESEARAYEVAGRFDLNWRGLARILEKERNLELTVAPPLIEDAQAVARVA
jgi:hypothetical protein